MIVAFIRGNYDKQLHGMAIENSSSRVLENLSMELLETQVLKMYPFSDMFWVQHVDDIFSL